MKLRRSAILLMSFTLGTALLGVGPAAVAAPTAPLNLDALFVGAHPDDEGFDITAFGQWAENYGLETGVVTITRGEGGGNAVGPEEGPALGLLREGEERRAVAYGFVDNIFYLDKVDFYYTVSAPLTEELWGHDSTLAKTVRIIRETKPDVIITMDPAPSPGNHGNHQFAARTALEAFYAAADPNVFSSQITQEGLQPWRAKRLFLGGLGLTSPQAAATSLLGGSGLLPTQVQGDCSPDNPLFGGASDSADHVYSFSNDGFSQRWLEPWFVVGYQALNNYASQGFSGATGVAIGALEAALCPAFIQVDSRVPFSAKNIATNAVFEGATYGAAGGLPLGTEFSLTVAPYHVLAGKAFTVTAHARWGGATRSPAATVALSLPDGWTWSAKGNGSLGQLAAGVEKTVAFKVTPSATAAAGVTRIGATLNVGSATGATDRKVDVVPPVAGRLERLPAVADFRTWANTIGVPQIEDIVFPVLSLGVGEARTIGVDLTNYSSVSQSGAVTITPPAGFAVAGNTQHYSKLSAGATKRVTFTVTNTDTSLATSSDGGDYPLEITTTSTSGTGTENAGLELVPRTSIPQAAQAPVVDGVAEPGEYSGQSLDVSRQWEGLAPPAGSQDASGTARVTWFGSDLYILVDVTDNVQGTSLDPSDCKRHWRTDSVELTIDPRANSENTSTTFKAGVLPWTNDALHGNPPCFERDADNHQGGPETAPGMQVASNVTVPYHGYTIEAKIPFADLPAAVDPAKMGLNILIYDSDTQDKTGQHRLGWSVWGGVQGDPYRWGHAAVTGYTSPSTMPLVAPPPIVPDTALLSAQSPQSIIQSVDNGVPMAGDAAAPSSDTVQFSRGPALSASQINLTLKASGPGSAYVFAWTGSAVAAQTRLDFSGAGSQDAVLSLSDAARDAMMNGGVVTVGWRTPGGAAAALVARPTVS